MMLSSFVRPGVGNGVDAVTAQLPCRMVSGEEGGIVWNSGIREVGCAYASPSPAGSDAPR